MICQDGSSTPSAGRSRSGAVDVVGQSHAVPLGETRAVRQHRATLRPGSSPDCGPTGPPRHPVGRRRHRLYRRTSSTMFSGVAAATRNRVKPAAVATSRSLAGPGLGAQRQTDVLGQRRRGAEQGGEAVVGAAHRVQVVLRARSPAAGSTIIQVPSGARALAGCAGPHRPGRPCRAARRTWSPGRSPIRRSRRPAPLES